MRVTTGAAKGRKLQMVPGDGTRPITDRAKQALFSILGNWVEETHVLDLFAGTGGVGIEALSRGAERAHFVDLNHKAIETARTNLRHCKLDNKATLEKADSFLFLQRYHGQPFHLIYVAPPQYQGFWSKALLLIDQRPHLLAKSGVVVVQIHPREETALTLSHLEEYDRRKYGSVLLVFYASKEDLLEQERIAGDDETDETDEADKDGETEENEA